MTLLKSTKGQRFTVDGFVFDNGNRYSWKKALELFGAAEGVGAQKIK